MRETGFFNRAKQIKQGHAVLYGFSIPPLYQKIKENFKEP